VPDRSRSDSEGIPREIRGQDLGAAYDRGDGNSVSGEGSCLSRARWRRREMRWRLKKPLGPEEVEVINGRGLFGAGPEVRLGMGRASCLHLDFLLF
jgi:hypothetical protein